MTDGYPLWRGLGFSSVHCLSLASIFLSLGTWSLTWLLPSRSPICLHAVFSSSGIKQNSSEGAPWRTSVPSAPFHILVPTVYLGEAQASTTLGLENDSLVYLVFVLPLLIDKYDCHSLLQQSRTRLGFGDGSGEKELAFQLVLVWVFRHKPRPSLLSLP